MIFNMQTRENMIRKFVEIERAFNVMQTQNE